ncbi:MAG: baseplate hub protein, partial [Minisyncoccia bacterium]
MKLFDRVIELTVGNTKISGLDIAFEIEKDLEPEPNPCHIEIYNLSAQNRAILSKQARLPVVLKAGYRDQVGIIFQGDMISCAHIKEGPTWKTVLTNGDGANAIQTARIKKSFAKGTPIKAVIKEIAEQLKIPSGEAMKQLEMITDELGRGFCAFGNPMDELCRILYQYGYTASIQNNSLQVLQ